MSRHDTGTKAFSFERVVLSLIHIWLLFSNLYYLEKPLCLRLGLMVIF